MAVLGQTHKFESTLTDILEKLYMQRYENPLDFWFELGLVFKTFLLVEGDEQTVLYQYCQILRTLSF